MPDMQVASEPLPPVVPGFVSYPLPTGLQTGECCLRAGLVDDLRAPGELTILANPRPSKGSTSTFGLHLRSECGGIRITLPHPPCPPCHDFQGIRWRTHLPFSSSLVRSSHWVSTFTLTTPSSSPATRTRQVLVLPVPVS